MTVPFRETPMAAGIDIEEMRETLHRVAAYKQVCEAVRSRAKHTIFNGFLFLGITALIYNTIGMHPILYVNAAIGIGEILVGVWKKVRPSPEGVLVDSLLQFAFVASVAVRVFLSVQNGGKPNPLSLIIGAWCLFDAVKTMQAYFVIRRAFAERPTRAQIAYIDDLLADVAEGNPETDPTALGFDTRPRVKAKLLGDVALVVIGRDDVALAERRQLRVDRLPTAKHPDNAALTVFGSDLPDFDLDAATWRNYAAWQTAGGNPPPPAVVRPARPVGPDGDE